MIKYGIFAMLVFCKGTFIWLTACCIIVLGGLFVCFSFGVLVFGLEGVVPYFGGFCF